MSVRRRSACAIVLSAALLWLGVHLIPRSAARRLDGPSGMEPGADVKATILSPHIPEDLTPRFPGPMRTLESLQHDFDVFSWMTFVALNWPAKGGAADTSVTIGQNRDAPAVWESWKQTYEVFLPGGAKPLPWGSAPQPPAYFSKSAVKLFEAEGRGFSKIAKGYSWSLPGMLTQNFQPFDAGPLIDQNGRYARFEVLINKDMFDFIVDNELYNLEGQERYTQKQGIIFPCGARQKEIGGKLMPARQGSIVIKAAWKQLSDDEVKSGRFHMRKAVVFTPKEIGAAHDEYTDVKFFGLVGIHIVHKSEDAPQWTWSTFEHVDNVPERGELPTSRQYSFYSGRRPQAKINAPPTRPWDPDPNKVAPEERRAQIVRMSPISPETKLLNETFQSLLRQVNPDSVWQYYQLVSTQWATQIPPAGVEGPPRCDVQKWFPVDVTGSPAPIFLANTTLESYIQGQVPNISSSCMACHANATTKNARYSDFTYVLERANSVGRGPAAKQSVNTGGTSQ